MWFQRKPKADPGVTQDLRGRALGVQPGELGLAPTTERPHVWGVITEIGYPKGIVTLVAFGEGSVSLYLSNGGGFIGAGEHPSVRATIAGFLSVAEAHRAELVPTAATPPPEKGRVRFYVRTFEGTLTAEADEQDLGNGRHALTPLYHAAHGVIAAVRVSQEGRSCS